MRLPAILCAAVLLLSQIVCGSQTDDSTPERNPDIDASWYTGRGVRPVGRFGRKVLRRKAHLGFTAGRVYKAAAGSSFWIKQ